MSTSFEGVMPVELIFYFFRNVNKVLYAMQAFRGHREIRRFFMTPNIIMATFIITSQGDPHCKVGRNGGNLFKRLRGIEQCGGNGCLRHSTRDPPAPQASGDGRSCMAYALGNRG